MTPKQKADLIAAQYGAVIEVEKWTSSTDLIAVAPDGKQWVDGQCIHMIEPYDHRFKGEREKAYDKLTERMESGIEELDETINP